MKQREKLAREMAEKSGYDYDKSNTMMQNAWLHNADVEIKRPSEPGIPAKVVIEDGVKVAEQSGVVIDGNPVGHIVVEIGPDSLDRADSGTSPSEGDKPATETPREPKPGEYLCSRCNTPHRKTSNIGIKHLKRQ